MDCAAEARIRQPAFDMTDDRTYQLAWGWPYQFAAAAMMVLGVSYPLLRHFIEWRQIESFDWWIAAAFFAGGLLTSVHYLLRVVVDDEGVTRSRLGVSTHLAWQDIRAIRVDQDQFVLLGTHDRELQVPMGMRNGLRFAQELDTRIAEGRYGLEWEATAQPG